MPRHASRADRGSNEKRTARPGESRRRFRGRVVPLGDAALLIEVGSGVDTALGSRCLNLATALARLKGIEEAVPAYGTVTVHYRPEIVPAQSIARRIETLLSGPPLPSAAPGRLHRIPVEYDGQDLIDVAARAGVSPERVVELHCAPIYRVLAVGFLPGWAYLGPVAPELRLPRRADPRPLVPAGSVAIASGQTGIYPIDSPGGWHLIGRTSVPTFMPDASPPLLLGLGDRVRFFPR